MEKVYFGIVSKGDVLHTGKPSGGNLGKMFTLNEERNVYKDNTSVKEYSIEEIEHDLKHGYIVDSKGMYDYLLNQQGTILLDSNLINKDFNTEEFLELSNNLGVQFIQTEIPFGEALKVVCDTLNRDPELYRAYKDNIAMAFQDEFRLYLDKDGNFCTGDIHECSNEAAKNFLDLLIK